MQTTRAVRFAPRVGDTWRSLELHSSRSHRSVSPTLDDKTDERSSNRSLAGDVVVKYYRRGMVRTWATALVVATSLVACTTAPPASPSLLPQPDDPGPPPAIPTTDGATFTLTSDGVSPKQARVYQGSRVVFIDHDVNIHEIRSDPLHLHTDCPELNAIGYIVTGQSLASDPLEHVRGCGFHDHVNDSDARFHGTVWVDAR